MLAPVFIYIAVLSFHPTSFVLPFYDFLAQYILRDPRPQLIHIDLKILQFRHVVNFPTQWLHKTC